MYLKQYIYMYFTQHHDVVKNNIIYVTSHLTRNELIYDQNIMSNYLTDLIANTVGILKITHYFQYM